MSAAPDPQTPTVSVTTTADQSALLLAIARLEGKVDAALTAHGGTLEHHDAAVKDHEVRLRVVESRPTVSPRGLWTTVSGALLVLVALFPALTRIFGGAS